jgi:hypothetical protein
MKRLLAFYQGGGAGEGIQLYPNPARKGNSFYITLPAAAIGEPVVLTIRDINGKPLLMRPMTASGPVQHNLPSGIYFVTILSRGTATAKKLIIE